MNTIFIDSSIKLFTYYKSLGEKAMEQVSEEKLFLAPNEESNSMAVIVRHLAGNMLSRFTDFLVSDGEKPWRNRDEEFENTIISREALMEYWNRGWSCLLNTLHNLTEADLETIVYIRNEGHTVLEAINRQLAHYSYHIGQIVYIAKMEQGSQWKSLSIPRNASAGYNAAKFSRDKDVRHFTDNV